MITSLIEFSIYQCSYYLLHTLLASTSLKNRLKTSFYRLIYNLIALVTFLPILSTLYTSVSNIDLLVNIFSMTGVVIFIIGLYIIWISFSQFEFLEFLGFKEIKDDSVGLLTTGLYGLSRHPMYFGSLLIFWSLFLIFWNDYFLCFSLISTIYIYVGSWSEEQKLIECFGERYRKYQKKVSMVIPFKVMKRRIKPSEE